MKMLTAKQIRNLNPERLKEFYRLGLTQKQIAEICGVSQAIINKRFKEYNIKGLST